VVPAIYNVITVPHILASICNWTYLRWYWKYIHNSMCVILQTWCQIQSTSSSLRYLNCGPGHIQCNYNSTCSGLNIQQNVAPLLLETSPQFNERYTANLEPNITHISQFTLCELCGPRHIQCNYSSTYSGFNIQLNLSALILEIYPQCNVRYTAIVMPNTEHFLQFTLYELWSRPYTV
jgi:hypothetical protein